MGAWQSEFARALVDPAAPLPARLFCGNPQRRFAVHRNNVRVSLTEALASRFPAVRKIVGEDFFEAAAKIFIAAHPPRSPLVMFYGSGFPAFLADFEPAREIPYLADVAALEAARVRAFHAADADPLGRAALETASPGQLANMRFALHHSLEIVASPHPVVTIWAMNSGGRELAPISDWGAEEALIVRPGSEVEVRRLPPGAAVFLHGLSNGKLLSEAAAAAGAADGRFDLALSLAALFAGLAIAMSEA